jgi:hypothetical protein
MLVSSIGILQASHTKVTSSAARLTVAVFGVLLDLGLHQCILANEIYRMDQLSIG